MARFAVIFIGVVVLFVGYLTYIGSKIDTGPHEGHPQISTAKTSRAIGYKIDTSPRERHPQNDTIFDHLKPGELPVFKEIAGFQTLKIQQRLCEGCLPVSLEVFATRKFAYANPQGLFMGAATLGDAEIANLLTQVNAAGLYSASRSADYFKTCAAATQLWTAISVDGKPDFFFHVCGPFPPELKAFESAVHGLIQMTMKAVENETAVPPSK